MSPRAACSRSSTRAPASPARCSSSRSPATGSTISRCRREARAPKIALSAANFGDYPMASGQSRLGRRFYDERPALEPLKANIGKPLDAEAAFALGLATSIPDDIDWADEIRIAVEERASMSPDALTAMEANLRFDGPETLATRVFGRLTAWQNWIFQRPNAVGDKGALRFTARAKRPRSTGTGCDGGVRGRGHQAAPDRPRNLHPLQHLRSRPARSARSRMMRATMWSMRASAISAWPAFRPARPAASTIGARCRARGPTAPRRSSAGTPCLRN